MDPDTNPQNIHDLPPDVLATIIRERLSCEDHFKKLEWWPVCHKWKEHWRDIKNSNDFWVSVLKQPPLNWHHADTFGARNADPMWDTGMTAFAFFQMLYRLTPDERELILNTSTTTIEAEAFFNLDLSGLTSLPPNLETIEVIAFSLTNLSGLTSLPPNLTTIKSDAFYNANLSGLTSLPPNLVTIETGAFAYADLRGLTSLPSDMILESLRINGAILPDFVMDPDTNPQNIHDLPPEVLAKIISERLSCEDHFKKLELWPVCHKWKKHWRDIRNSNDFWVSVLKQPPLNWHHADTFGARNADPRWDTGMTAFAFFQMLYRLTPDERELILNTSTTTIDAEAFFHADLSGLTSLPPNLETIEVIAFSLANLSGLTSLPPNLTTIKSDAFYNADLSGLTSLPPNLVTIETGAFAYADLRGLTSLPSDMILESLRSNEAMLPDFTNTPSA